MQRTYFMGDRELPSVLLSKAERSCLARAAGILARLRELRDDEDDDLTTDVALASHVCLELAQDGEVKQ